MSIFLKNKFRLILEKSGFSKMEFGRRTGITDTYVAAILSGKRPATEKTMLKVLVGVGGQTPAEARKVLATWKIEEAQKELGTGNRVREPHEIYSRDTLETADKIEKMSPEKRNAIKKFLE